MEIAIIVIVVAVAAFAYLFYTKRKKALDDPANLKNDGIKTESHETAVTPKVEVASPPAVAPAAETAVVAEVVQAPPATEVKAAVEPAQKTAPAVSEDTAESSDEEPMLKRHHLHNIRVMLAATTFPHPTDSALSRHYDEMIDAKAEDCLADEAKMTRLVADYEAYENAQLAKDNAAPAHADTQASVAAPKVCCHHKRCAVPEDSMLRRHYLSLLRAKIEKNKAPRPTDSTLRRHYDAMIEAEIKKCLTHK